MKHMGTINPDFTGETTGSECPKAAPGKGQSSVAVTAKKKRRKKFTCLELLGKERRLKERPRFSHCLGPSIAHSLNIKRRQSQSGSPLRRARGRLGSRDQPLPEEAPGGLSARPGKERWEWGSSLGMVLGPAPPQAVLGRHRMHGSLAQGVDDWEHLSHGLCSPSLPAAVSSHGGRQDPRDRPGRPARLRALSMLHYFFSVLVLTKPLPLVLLSSWLPDFSSGAEARGQLL